MPIVPIVIVGDMIVMSPQTTVKFTPAEDSYLYIRSNKIEVSRTSNQWYAFTSNTTVSVKLGESMYLRSLADTNDINVHVIDNTYVEPNIVESTIGVGTSDPTANINPSSISTIYVNINTGEIFSCMDNTPNANVWKGQVSTDTIIESLTRTVQQITAPGTTDQFTLTPGYTAGKEGFVDVYIDRMLMIEPRDYVLSNGDTLTFTNPPASIASIIIKIIT